MIRTLHRGWLAVLAVVAVVAALMGAQAPAQAATTTGTIVGTIIGADDHPSGDPVLHGPLPGMRASAVNATTGAYVKSATTDSAGRFSLAGLPPATYKVKYVKTSWLVVWTPAFTLAAGQTKDLGSRTIAAEAVITGQVLANFDPIDGAKVVAFDAVTGKGVAAVIADVSGQYRIGQLPAGSYKVRGSKAGLFDSWADGASAYVVPSTFASAGVYQLLAGQVLEQSWDPVRLYIDLAPQVTITGSVFGFSHYDPSGVLTGCTPDWDDPLGGVRVSAVDSKTGAFVKSVSTDSNGRFAITELRPAPLYRLKLKKDCWTTTWFPGQYGQVWGTQDAGEAFMYGEITISGQVLSNMDPIGGARVSVIDVANGATIAATIADSSGNYTLGQLPVGADGNGISVKVKAAKSGYRDSWANYPATYSNAEIYRLAPGDHLTQTWSPQPSLYLDLQPLP